MRKLLLSITLLAGFFLSVWAGIDTEGAEALHTYPSCERSHYPFTLKTAVVESQMESLLEEHAKHSDIHSLSCSRRDRRLSALCHSVRRVGMFDVGSTGIRLLVADIDLVTSHINRLCSFEYSMPFGLSEEDSLARLAAIGAMKRVVEERYGSVQEIEFSAVATAGFRSAGEQGQALAKDITRITGVEFKVIDQDREGVLAFLGANLEYPRADPSRVVVWDIGGGSMQITMKQADAPLLMAGCEIAARTFLEQTLTRVKKGGQSLTPNPMSVNEAQQTFDLARALLTGTSAIPSGLMPFDAKELALLRERIRSEKYVLGIGGVHARIVLPCVRAVTGVREPRYTPESLRQTIDYMIAQEFTDEGIHQFVGSNMDNFPSTLPSLILVYTVLELLGIKHVQVLDINNTQGLVAEYVKS